MAMTTRDRWWKVVVPALAAVLGSSCGRSLTLDDRPLVDAGAGGSSPAASDGGDAPVSGGSGGTTGSGGATASGGTTGSGGADAGMDRQPMIDATKDMVDVRPDVPPDLPPDLPPDRPPPPPEAGGCPANCNMLPHVRAGAYVPCINGVCSVSYGTTSCDPGFSHCSGVPNVGCETDVSASPNCGGCNNQCYFGYECRLISGVYY